MLLSLILGSSPHLPVSVCGTGTIYNFYNLFSPVYFLVIRYLFSLYLSIRVFPLPRLPSIPVSVIVSKYIVVQESLPAVHRIRFSASP